MGGSAPRISCSPHQIDARRQFPFKALGQLLLAAPQPLPVRAPQQLRVPLCLLRGLFLQILKCSNRRIIAAPRPGEFLALVAIEREPARQLLYRISR